MDKLMMPKIIAPKPFALCGFHFMVLRKEDVTFIMVKSKFLQDDRNVIQLDMKEFHSAAPCAPLLTDSEALPFFVRAVNHLKHHIAFILLEEAMLWLSSFPPHTLYLLEHYPANFLFIIFPLCYISCVSCQPPNRVHTLSPHPTDKLLQLRFLPQSVKW